MDISIYTYIDLNIYIYIIGINRHITFSEYNMR